MLLNIVFIIVGVALVLWGADRLTEAASSLARDMRVPEIIIGLTILAAGTSAPSVLSPISADATVPVPWKTCSMKREILLLTE